MADVKGGGGGLVRQRYFVHASPWSTFSLGRSCLMRLDFLFMLVDAAMVLIIYQHRPNLISACFLPDPGEGGTG